MPVGSGANVGFDPFPTQLSDYTTPIVVCRFDREADPGNRYLALPNVYCRGIQRREGPEPSVARFEYTFDDSDPTSPFPSQFDQVWPIGATGPHVLQADDEIVVLGYTTTGAKRPIFHGHVQVPQVDVQPAAQSVTFTAMGVEARCWDNPVKGAFYRNADDPSSTDEEDRRETDLPTRFNPNGSGGKPEPNCTPLATDVDEGTPAGYPLFLEPGLIRTPDPRTQWTVGRAVRYLLARWNEQDADPLWVKNPSFVGLDDLLLARKPKAGQFYNPSDPATYTSSLVIVRDYDATNRAWPEAVAELCGFAGASIRFELGQDSHDEPVTRLVVFRKDASSTVAPKDLHLQQAYEVLDPAKSDVQDLHVARDAVRIANAFIIETDPIQFEASIVLAPWFTPVAGDQSDATRKTFLATAIASAGNAVRAKYRIYVGDEAGDGHWDYASSTLKSGDGAALDLSDVFGEDDPDEGPAYVRRLRRCLSTLLSKDPAGKPLKALLCLSRDYAGAVPGVWDGTGHWQPIASGWELLKDRIGIRVTAEDPEDWSIGAYSGANAQNDGKTLRGITSQANPSPTEKNTKRFYLMLTTVIEWDIGLVAQALKRDASPTRFVRTRRIDCKDHFKHQIAAANSWYNQTTTPVTKLDDTAKAEAHAQALRAAHEFPPLAGSVTIPWLANAYRVGDRLRMIKGRDVSLAINAGTSSGEAPQYPFVVEVDYDFSGEAQRTTLHYSDRMSDPQRA